MVIRFGTTVAFSLATVILGPGMSNAHTTLQVPNGGEVLAGGSSFTIRWRVDIQHNTENWDLWYSTTGVGGPWIVIAEDLPVGDPTAGSVHTYEWTVPDFPTTEARVRVRQDNSATDYLDISDADFVIGDPNDADGDGVANIEDNCPLVFNPTQTDSDTDGFGDACDECPGSDDALDDDADGVPNGCDICLGFDDAADGDSDGVPNGCDNCPSSHNPGQEDGDSDGIGDVCEGACCTGSSTGNADCTGIIDIGDVTELIQLLFIRVGDPYCCEDEADLDYSGDIDIGDLTLLIQSLFITLEPLPTCPVSETQLQISLFPAKDNTLYEDASGSLSNGMGSYLFAGRTGQTGGNKIRRSVLAFDIAGAIAPGAQIDSAELVLNMSRSVSGSQTIGLHRLLADWGEGSSDAAAQEGGGAAATTDDATWLHRFSDTALWAAAGGDYDPTLSASQSVDGIGSYTWGSTAQIVADVQAWLDNPESNYGWIIIGNEATTITAKRFDSKDHAVSNVRPTLTIFYAISAN
jgi:hypothetical protein